MVEMEELHTYVDLEVEVILYLVGSQKLEPILWAIYQFHRIVEVLD